MAKVVMARAGMRQLAKLVAGDLGRGEITAGLESVGSALASSPEAVLAVLDLLLAERHKTRPGERLIDAFLFMLGKALRESRLAQEGGAPEPARTLIAGVRGRIVAMTGAEPLPPDLLLALAQLFVSAGLDPGDDLRACLRTEVAAPAGGAAVDPADLGAQYGALAAALRDDPFLIHGQVAWTALAARDAVEDEAWMDFALVALELLGERPLARIPVAMWIARNTAAALRRR
ncbi:hypothetical protein [Methylobacterium sp. sgz302541]|uniref:hypothetical protein n=1 Tax=unclassified Methylobacterium TaxID=2615210 RepID=UPI003D333A4F